MKTKEVKLALKSLANRNFRTCEEGAMEVSRVLLGLMGYTIQRHYKGQGCNCCTEDWWALTPTKPIRFVGVLAKAKKT